MDFAASKKGPNTVLTVKKAVGIAKYFGFDPARGEVVNNMSDIPATEQHPEGASLPLTDAIQGNNSADASLDSCSWEDISFETTQ